MDSNTRASKTPKKCAKKTFSASKQGFECAPEKKTWKRKLNSLHIQDGPTKHACFMAIYMIVELKTTLAKAKRAAAERHGASMSQIESVAKEVLGQEFFDRRNKFKRLERVSLR
jgi:hypothetical protein